MSLSDIKIFDKVIPKGYEDDIENDLFRTNFPWYYIDDVTNKKYGNNSGLAHVAYELGGKPSDWFTFIKPLSYAIEEASGYKMEKLLRVRIGFLTKTTEPEYKYNTPHVDFIMPHYTACYYVNDSDGDTILFDKTLKDLETKEITEDVLNEYGKTADFNIVSQCSPKKGSLCIFDGHRFHASTKPKIHDRRLVITINYTSNVS